MNRAPLPAGSLYPDSVALSKQLERFRQGQVDLTGDEYRRGHEIAGQIMSELATSVAKYAYLPRIHRSDSFLAGSLGRRTQERPLDDIDLYLVVNGGGLFMHPDRETVPVALYGSLPNPLATNPWYVVGRWVSSWLMLQSFQAAAGDVAQRCGATLGMSSKRKTLNLKWSNLNVDLGFVLWGRAPQRKDDRYYLPKGNSEVWWSATNPKLDQQRLTERNQGGGGQLLPLIRVVKWWNRYRNQDRLKGIHLEVMVENAFGGVSPAPLFPALCHVFQKLRAMVTQSSPDPTGLGGPLDSSLSAANRSASKQQLDLAANWLLLAAGEIQAGNDWQATQYTNYVFPIV